MSPVLQQAPQYAADNLVALPRGYSSADTWRPARTVSVILTQAQEVRMPGTGQKERLTTGDGDMLNAVIDGLEATIKRIPQPLRLSVNLTWGLMVLVIAYVVLDIILPAVAHYVLIVGIQVIFLAFGVYLTVRLLFLGLQRMRRSRN